jgi:hypothetical protein
MRICPSTAFGISAGDETPQETLFASVLGECGAIIDPFNAQGIIQPFHLNKNAFLRKARATFPRTPESTVSSFAAWVHSLYARDADDDARQRGIEAEPEIFRRRREILSTGPLWGTTRRDWELIHNGLHVDNAHGRFGGYFEIPSLLVSGRMLRANPDLIYRNRMLGGVVVVELKFTRKAIPEDLWPDIWAQLWAYSHIPEIATSQSVTVVGEIWGDNPYIFNSEFSDFDYNVMIGFVHDVYLRAVVRRNPRSVVFQNFFSSLFHIYAGHAQAMGSPSVPM